LLAFSLVLFFTQVDAIIIKISAKLKNLKQDTEAEWWGEECIEDGAGRDFKINKKGIKSARAQETEEERMRKKRKEAEPGTAKKKAKKNTKDSEKASSSKKSKRKGKDSADDSNTEGADSRIKSGGSSKKKKRKVVQRHIDDDDDDENDTPMTGGIEGGGEELDFENAD
jgi:membrane-bound lytic murein transglycosylase